MKVCIQGISKEYKTKYGNVPVLKDINLTVREQEFLCILGPSGCGKTTLLRIIAKLLSPTSGKVDLYGTGSQANHNIAMVFQELGAFPWMNVIDNVCFGLQMQGMPKKERYNLVLPVIKRLGLGAFTAHYPHQLSVGMKQRVGVARALVSGAEVLLMDEPFAALDAQTRLISQEKLLEVCRDYQKTVIYVTHDIDESLLLADRIILLTARPSMIKEEITINIPKPRNIATDGELLKMKQGIWEHLREEVNKAI